MMTIIEKRDFIHSHLHQINDAIINELYEKIHADIDRDELSQELKNALDKGICSLENRNRTAHEGVMRKMKAKYPDLIK